jgi:hypothetical protein
MAKKGKRKRSSRRHNDKSLVSLTVGETDIQMLAWLDYTLSRPGARGLFCSTVEEYLSEEYGISMTLEQVKQRFECLSKRFSSTWHDIYRQGSTCLLSIDEQVRAEIADRTVCLQLLTTHRAIDGRGRRILRSKSRAPENLVAEHTQPGAAAASTSASSHKKCQSRREGSLLRKNDTSFSRDEKV